MANPEFDDQEEEMKEMNEKLRRAKELEDKLNNEILEIHRELSRVNWELDDMEKRNEVLVEQCNYQEKLIEELRLSE